MEPLLSEEQISRIKSEERIRAELRAAILPDTPKGNGRLSKVWSFLNSTFGIWFLTAVFVTGLGSLASMWYEKEREAERKHEAQLAEEAKKREVKALEESRRKEIYERITLEISYRYSATLAELRAASERFGSSKNRKARAAIVSALRPLARPASNTNPPLFNEYETYSSFALIAELRRHSGVGEANMLTGILARTSALIYEVSLERNGCILSAKSVAALLIETMRHPKWNNGFAYTDCPSDNPFC